MRPERAVCALRERVNNGTLNPKIHTKKGYTERYKSGGWSRLGKNKPTKTIVVQFLASGSKRKKREKK